MRLFFVAHDLAIEQNGLNLQKWDLINHEVVVLVLRDCEQVWREDTENLSPRHPSAARDPTRDKRLRVGTHTEERRACTRHAPRAARAQPTCTADTWTEAPRVSSLRARASGNANPIIRIGTYIFGNQERGVARRKLRNQVAERNIHGCMSGNRSNARQTFVRKQRKGKT
jgi:hypothetical protein